MSENLGPDELAANAELEKLRGLTTHVFEPGWLDRWQTEGDDMPCPECGQEQVETRDGVTCCRACGWQADNPLGRVPGQRVTEETITCPECGSPNAVRKMFHQTVAMYTGEVEDDEWPAIETVELHPGFSIECPECGALDGEPPQL